MPFQVDLEQSDFLQDLELQLRIFGCSEKTLKKKTENWVPPKLFLEQEE